MKTLSLLLLCLLQVITLVDAQSHSAPKIVFAELPSLMDQAARPEGLQLLVTLDFQEAQTVAAADQHRDAIASAQTRFAADLAGLNARVVVAYLGFPVALVHVDRAALRRILDLPEVTHVQPDGLNQVSDNGTNAAMHTAAAWNSGYDGTGLTIVVLDTGVQTNHPFLGNRVVSEACFSGGSGAAGYSSLCPNGQGSQFGTGAGIDRGGYSGCGHGTSIAGIAAGMNAGSGYDGVARNANLASIQIYSLSNMNSVLFAFDSDVLSALQYVHTTLVTNPSLHIAAVALSLSGSTTSTSPCDGSAYKPAIDTLRADGVAVVISAGNSGAVGLSSPACVSSAISVGATDNSDSVPAFSNRASFMSLFAPGVSVMTSNSNNTYITVSGTSMAAAQAAGAWAIMKQRLPASSVGNILTTLQVSGKPIATNGFTKARIDFAGALDVIFVDGFN